MNFQDAQRALNLMSITPEAEHLAQSFLSQFERAGWRGPDTVIDGQSRIEIAWHGEYKADEQAAAGRKADDIVAICILPYGEWFVRQITRNYGMPEKGKTDNAVSMIEAMIAAQA